MAKWKYLDLRDSPDQSVEVEADYIAFDGDRVTWWNNHPAGGTPDRVELSLRSVDVAWVYESEHSA